MAYVGIVEIHHDGAVAGWCYNEDFPDSPVTVSLFCGDVLLRNIRAERFRQDVGQLKGVFRAGFWQSLETGLVRKIPAGTMLRLVAPNGEDLAFASYGNCKPIGEALDSGQSLSECFQKGYIVDKWGAFSLPFKAMSNDLRQAYAKSLGAAATYFRDRFGITLFAHYGTLLGYARGKKFIPHDDDTDCSYVMNAESLDEVADRFFELVHAIRADGHKCVPVCAGQMHVCIDGETVVTDIFSSWHQSNRVFNTYFGVSGLINEPLTFFEDQMEGVSMNIPHQYEKILALTYGPSWSIPDPSFQWNVSKEVEDQMKALKALGVERCKALTAG